MFFPTLHLPRNYSSLSKAEDKPNNCGIGGDVFALFYDAKTKTVKGVNGSGRAPAALSAKKVKELLGKEGEGLNKIPYTSVHAVTVPGSAGAWCDMVDKWGSGKIDMGEILAVSPLHPGSGV